MSVTTQQIVESMSPRSLAAMIAKAQRLALAEWQHSRQPPGLAARFTKEAHHFYQFADRYKGYLNTKRKRGKPDYVFSGATQKFVENRNIVTSRSGGVVISRLKFGGGIFNILKSIRPISVTKTIAVVAVKYGPQQVSEHTRTRYRNHGATSLTAAGLRTDVSNPGVKKLTTTVAAHTRRAYEAQRSVVVTQRTQLGIDYATPFGDMSRDEAFIRMRYQEYLRELAGAMYQRNQRAAIRGTRAPRKAT